MAENKRGQAGGDNRSGQDRNRSHQGPQDRNRGFFNNPSGETRGVNPAEQNKRQPTDENVASRTQSRHEQRNQEVPQREEEHETKQPKAEKQRQDDVYGQIDGDAGSQ
jgi:hypothetical protein